MSISQLGEIDVSSVSKSPQSLSDAPAAIYVITHDDIVRSGARSCRRCCGSRPTSRSPTPVRATM